MFPPSKDRPGQVRTYSTGPFRALADNARAAEWSAIRPEDEGRLFYEKPFWQKLIIMASGPTMNILLAFLILLGVSLSYGVYRSQLTISTVQECIVVVNAADQSCTGKPPTPAAQSGIQPGDKIVAFNGTPVSSWDDVSRLIRSNLDHPALVSRRAGRSAHRAEARQYGDHRRTEQV
jgi:membrane-associated protease RseP (regulator of RpoE activity)